MIIVDGDCNVGNSNLERTLTGECGSLRPQK